MKISGTLRAVEVAVVQLLSVEKRPVRGDVALLRITRGDEPAETVRLTVNDSVALSIDLKLAS